MKAQLQPYLQYSDDETSSSFVRRLSQLHTGQGANRLLADLGIDLRAFSRGAPAAITRIADVAGVEAGRLERGVILRLDRSRGFRGERWSSGFVLREGRRICPVCLQEDAPAGTPWLRRGRILWRIRSMMTCPVHGRPLVETMVPNTGDELGRDFPSVRDVSTFPHPASRRPLTSLEAMIAARIEESPTSAGSWLDGQTLEQGARACEMIGAVIAFGKRFAAKDMSADDWRHAAEVGFAYARRGEDGIRAAFDEILSVDQSTAGQAGPRSGYGRVFEWLSDTTPAVEFGPIRPLLRDHVLDNFSVKPGEMLLGQKVMKRRMHSIHSLSVNTGIHRKRLRKALVQLGYIDEDSWEVAAHHLVVPAEVAEQISKDLKETVPLQLLPELLLCTRTQAESLYRDDVVVPLLDKDEETGIGRIAFARRTIALFLESIEAVPQVERAAAPEYVDLTGAAKKTGRSTGFIVRKILNGSLRGVRLPGEVGLVRIRIASVDLTSIKGKGEPAPPVDDAA